MSGAGALYDLHEPGRAHGGEGAGEEGATTAAVVPSGATAMLPRAVGIKAAVAGKRVRPHPCAAARAPPPTCAHRLPGGRAS